MKLLTPFVPMPLNPDANPRPARAIETDEEILAKKEQFAELMLREDEPFKVALLLYPDDTGRALQVAHEWPRDPQVIELQKSLKDAEGEITFLPTKADLARAIWQLAARDDIAPEDRDSKIKALRTYGDVRGFVERPAVAVQQNIQNNTLQTNVMVVRVHGDDAEWSNKLRNQQKRLKAEVAAEAEVIEHVGRT